MLQSLRPEVEEVVVLKTTRVWMGHPEAGALAFLVLLQTMGLEMPDRGEGLRAHMGRRTVEVVAEVPEDPAQMAVLAELGMGELG